jgi:hypothetical protein
MRSATLRRTLLGLLEAGLVTTALAGCGLDEDCTETRHRRYRIAEPPPAAYQSLLRACQADADECQALCDKMLTEWDRPAVSCEVEHRPTEHLVVVGYTYYTGASGCPTPGRRPAGLCHAATAARGAVGAYLARAAWFEGASVHAFVQLARQLVRHDAPARLVRAALRAAVDEVRHARIMSALATTRGATPPPVEVRPPTRRSLASIASENATEGCVGETWAALVAMWQAQRAADPDIQAAFAAIAGDELRHAALSWELDAWLAPQLSATAQRRVRRARAEAIEALEHGLATDDAELVRHLGLPTADAARAMFERACQTLWA